MSITLKHSMCGPIKFNLYKRPGTLVNKFLSYRGDSKSGKRYFLFYNPESNKFTRELVTKDKFVKGIKNDGAWGYAETRKNIVNLWMARETFIEKQAYITLLIGHEIAHIAYLPMVAPLLDCKKREDYIHFEEALCNAVGEIGILARQVYDELSWEL